MKVMKAPDKQYLRLIERVPLLPIETEKQSLLARALLHELIQNDKHLQASEIGYAKVLAKLVQDYAKHKNDEPIQSTTIRQRDLVGANK
jgi:hypothetical protein